MSKQEAIWSYFQGDRADTFDGAYWRLGRLLHYASRYYSNPTIANIGIGNGYLERNAKRRGWNVIAIDPDENAVNRLLADNIDARCGAIEKLPIAEASIDTVFASEVFEHLTEDSLSDGLLEIKRVLKTGGRLIGTVPFDENLREQECMCPRCGIPFHRWGHEQSFTPDKMRHVLSQYFAVEVCEPKYFPSWKMMDVRSKINAALRIAFLNPAGTHRPNENILFIAEKLS